MLLGLGTHLHAQADEGQGEAPATWNYWLNKIPKHMHTSNNLCEGCKLPPQLTPGGGNIAGDILPSHQIAGAEATFPLSNIPQLASRPGAPAIIYLDFDGHTIEVGWNNDVNPGQDAVARAYSKDADETTFSRTELQDIKEIWEIVSEDFRPWDVDVTTILPSESTLEQVSAIRVCIGGSWEDWFGSPVGGVAGLNTFNHHTHSFFPCHVFPENLNLDTQSIASTTSHEIGHTLGLNHQSEWNGSTLVREYREGIGSGLTGVIAIMGGGAMEHSDLWWDGLNPYQQQQDDMAKIAETLDFIPDDHGNDLASATLVDLTTPSSQGGFIHQMTDIDYFEATLEDGQIRVEAFPPQIGPNLDISLTLYNHNGTQVANSQPTEKLSASIATTVTAGTYFISVTTEGTYGRIGS